MSTNILYDDADEMDYEDDNLILTNDGFIERNEDEDDHLEEEDLKQMNHLYDQENRALACWSQIERLGNGRLLAKMRFPQFFAEFF